MNINEAISKAKELIYDEQGDFVSYIDLSDVFDELTIYEQAIETLINEYNNLKQIEEAHRIENGKLREELKRTKNIDIYKLIEAWETGQLISKDKITKKIENLEKIRESFTNSTGMTEISTGIDVLKELLEGD